MGEGESAVLWYESSPRAILPIELPSSSLHITRSLKQVLNKNLYTIKYDTAFKEVINKCAQIRTSTWINRLIIKTFTDLYKHGFAHSVEAWKDNKLAGGLYGVAFKGAFFGESMFHTESNASKSAVVSLYDTLKKNKFILFDIQMMTPVFQTFGAVNITKEDYMVILRRAMKTKRNFEI
jgi:leucyl/phenylalanyl-tRNA--protein transferase